MTSYELHSGVGDVQMQRLLALVDEMPSRQVKAAYVSISRRHPTEEVYAAAKRAAEESWMSAPTKALPAVLQDVLESSAAAILAEMVGRLGRSRSTRDNCAAARGILRLRNEDASVASLGLVGLLRRGTTALSGLLARPVIPKVSQVCAFCEFRDPLSVAEAISWLKECCSDTHLIGGNQRRRFFIARVTPKDKHFSAAWLRLNARDQIILVNRAATGQQFVDYVFHEFEHITDYEVTHGCARVNT